MQIERVVQSRSKVGEGAVWDVEDQRLWWVDIPAGLIHRYDPSSGDNDTFEVGEAVGCLSRREAGGLIIATRSGFHLFDPDTSQKTPLADPEVDRPGNRFNDGAMKDDDGPPDRVGQFYRFDPDGTLTRHFDPVYTTNGMAFSPDGQTLYFSASNPQVRTIWACDYDLDTGTPRNRQVFFDTRAVAGRPDGGTVDAFVWPVLAPNRLSGLRRKVRSTALSTFRSRNPPRPCSVAPTWIGFLSLPSAWASKTIPPSPRLETSLPSPALA